MLLSAGRAEAPAWVMSVAGLRLAELGDTGIGSGSAHSICVDRPLTLPMERCRGDFMLRRELAPVPGLQRWCSP